MNIFIMKKINFQDFKIYTSVSHAKSVSLDVREKFADMIYQGVNGIKAHSLAFKIYGSEGETEYEDGELELIRSVAEQMCVPGFIDGLNEQTGE